jgi:hypothetical protein
VIALEGVRDVLNTRLGTVSGIYATRYIGTASVTPAPSVGYVEAEFRPATAEAITLGTDGVVERTGLYFVRLYSPTGGGTALDALADTTLAAFERGVTLTTADSAQVRISGRPAPSRTELVASTAGRSAVLLTIPWQVRTAD